MKRRKAKEPNLRDVLDGILATEHLVLIALDAFAAEIRHLTVAVREGKKTVNTRRRLEPMRAPKMKEKALSD